LTRKLKHVSLRAGKERSVGISRVDSEGIAEIVMANPPVNALTVAGWFELADLVREAGADPSVRAVVLRAEGRGFNAGVDIKEMQRTEGHTALIGANRGCYAAFEAVYACAVPVISAVNGYCLGGGIGLVGNSDVIVAADDATFGLPEVERGALGAATHLARDKRMTEDEFAAELSDGMTVGIGGWGSRRKPMAFVRALVRSGVKDLTIVSYGGPDVGILCATGQARKVVYGFVSLDSIALEPHFRNARQAGTIEAVSLDEGMFRLGLQAAAWRLPFLPTRAGLGSDVLVNQPQIRTVKSPYDDGEELVAIPAQRLDVAFIHMNRADTAGNGQYLGPRPVHGRALLHGRRQGVHERREDRPHREPARRGHVPHAQDQPHDGAGRGARAGRSPLHRVPPDYERDEAFQKEYAASAKDAASWEAWKAKYLDVTEDEYQKAVAK
jgi:glutaconate CoA-transferase subunit A